MAALLICGGAVVGCAGDNGEAADDDDATTSASGGTGGSGAADGGGGSGGSTAPLVSGHGFTCQGAPATTEWGVTFGDGSLVHTAKVGRDDACNIYFVGLFSNAFEAGEDIFAWDEGTSIGVAKLDPEGNLIWSRFLDGLSAFSLSRVDFADFTHDGTMLLSGKFQDEVTIDGVTYTDPDYGKLLVELNSDGEVTHVESTDMDRYIGVIDGDFLLTEPFGTQLVRRRPGGEQVWEVDVGGAAGFMRYYGENALMIRSAATDVTIGANVLPCSGACVQVIVAEPDGTVHAKHVIEGSRGRYEIGAITDDGDIIAAFKPRDPFMVDGASAAEADVVLVATDDQGTRLWSRVITHVGMNDFAQPVALEVLGDGDLLVALAVPFEGAVDLGAGPFTPDGGHILVRYDSATGEYVSHEGFRTFFIHGMSRDGDGMLIYGQTFIGDETPYTPLLGCTGCAFIARFVP